MRETTLRERSREFTMLDSVGFRGTDSLQAKTKELGMKVLMRGAILLAAGTVLVAVAPSALGAGPYQYFAITPCRIVDTRTTARVKNDAFVNFTIKGVCGVPVDAVAASLNVTVVAPTASGFMFIWPAGGSPPNVSTINWAAGEPAIANGAILPLTAGTPDISIGIGPCPGGCPAVTATFQLDVILDVTGYFKP
jgi:hypothetical protein